MRHRLPSLNALRAFEAAGRSGSLTAAGRELGVSVGAISRHVALLEAHFGCALLTRHRSGVEPTTTGQAYLREIERAFDLIDRASRTLAQNAKTRPLKLRLYTSFTTEWLAPRLPAFRAAQPAIELDITLSTRDAQADADEADLFITTALPNDPALHADRMFEMVATLVCAPGLLETGWATPADLDRHTMLFAPRERLLWNALLQSLGAARLEENHRLQFDMLSLTLQAARGGGGVALGNLFFVVDDLLHGRLIAPFDVTLGFDLPHYLVCRADRLCEPAIAAFRAWLLAEVATTVAVVESFLLDRQVARASLADMDR